MPLRGEPDIVASRQLVRKLTQQLGFTLVDQTKMVTAASELSRNTVTYGGAACACAFATKARAFPTSPRR